MAVASHETVGNLERGYRLLYPHGAQGGTVKVLDESILRFLHSPLQFVHNTSESPVPWHFCRGKAAAQNVQYSACCLFLDWQRSTYPKVWTVLCMQDRSDEGHRPVSRPVSVGRPAVSEAYKQKIARTPRYQHTINYRNALLHTSWDKKGQAALTTQLGSFG